MRPIRAGRLTVRPRSSRTVNLAWAGVKSRPEAQGDPVDPVVADDSIVKDDLVDSAFKDGLVVVDVADVADKTARTRTMVIF
jgi:hypothetical protein